MWLVLLVLVPWALLSMLLALLVGAGIGLRERHGGRPRLTSVQRAEHAHPALPRPAGQVSAAPAG